jgi:hypothetical protein
MANDEKLRQLAMDIVDGKVYTSDQIPDANFARMIRLVFMPVGLLDQEAIKSLQDDDITMFYEYFSAAGSRSINGLPMFTTIRYLNRDDHKRLGVFVKRYIEMKQQFTDNT